MEPPDAAPEARRLERVLDAELGFFWWRRYIAAAFWSNVSTPLNLAVTLFTALTTAQTATGNLLPHPAHVGLSVATLVVSVVNTFFRPHDQMTANLKVLGELEKYGDAFEAVYYSGDATPADAARRLAAYKDLRAEVDRYATSVSIESRNFLTDLLHLAARATALRGGREAWLYPAALAPAGPQAA